MTTISSIGVGSGLDVNNLLEQLVAAERGPTENRLNVREARIQAEVSAIGTLKSSADAFQTSLRSLKLASNFGAVEAQSSNEDILTATASSSAEEASYSLNVNALAQEHSLATIAFDDLDQVVGSGTLTFSFGTTEYDPGTDFETGDDIYTSFTRDESRAVGTVVLDASNNTVSGVRDAINEADIGITATLVDDGTGFRLLLSSEAGIDNSLEVTVDEGGDPASNTDIEGLSRLAFNSSATNLEQTQSASSAELSINGLRVTRDSNTIADLIPGVSLELQSADIGNTVQLNVNKTAGDIAENIQAFVSTYNELVTTIQGFTRFDASTGQGGILQGDATSREFINLLRQEITSITRDSGPFSTLSSIGIQLTRTGTLELDDQVLGAAINDDFEAVGRLFHFSVNASGSNVELLSSGLNAAEGNYAVDVTTPASAGQLVAEAPTFPLTVTEGNNNFSLAVDGISSGELTLEAATYNSASEFAAQLRSVINAAEGFSAAGVGVSADVVDGQLVISSNSYGDRSSVTVENGNALIGLSENATATPGNNVEGGIGPLPAVGNGRILTGTGSLSSLSVEVRGTDTGTVGRIDIVSGLTNRLDAILDSFLSSSGRFDSQTELLGESITDINDQRLVLEQRVAATEARFRAQFEALDVLVGQLTATGDFLLQQLDSLPGFVSDNQ